MPTLRRAAKGLLWAGVVALLASCSQTAVPVAEPGADPDPATRLATVDIAADATPESVVATYGGEIVVFRPEAGFAVVGLTDTRGADDHAALIGWGWAEKNRGVVAAPGARDALANGFSAWAGGFSAWAGGVSAWAGGVSAWAGGSGNPFPGNENAWSQIGLGLAQDLAVNDGAGVKVAVIDTGIDLDHSAFEGRLAPEGEWLDLVDGDRHPDEVDGDYYGHGTAVAGIVLQAAPNATILPIRVLGPDGSGDLDDVARGIDHAVAMGAQVINLSLGTATDTRTVDRLVDYAQSRNVSVVASSGNTGDRNVTYPAAGAFHPKEKLLIGVGSVDSLDRKSVFSTYGGNLEMLAPGQGITTLFPDDRSAVVSGTSFAAPWVSGTIALSRGDGALASSVTQDTATSSFSVDHLNPGFERDLGRGRLDALTAFRRALGL